MNLCLTITKNEFKQSTVGYSKGGFLGYGGAKYKLSCDS